MSDQANEIEQAIREWAINYKRRKEVHGEELSTPAEVGKALKEIKDKHGYYLVGFKDFYVYCAKRFGMRRPEVDGYIHKFETGISPINTKNKTTKEMPENRVYFVRGGNLIKIGYAHNPQKRIRDIQQISPLPLTLIGTVNGGPTLEKEIHYRFGYLNNHGEWFQAAPELLDFIKQVCHE